MTAEKEPLYLSGTFKVTLDMGAGRAMEMLGQIMSNESIDQINAKVDQFHSVIDRQRLRVELEKINHDIESNVAGMEHYRDVLAELKARDQPAGLSKDAPRLPKLTSQERLTLNNGQRTIEKGQEMLDKLRARRAEIQQTLGIAAESARP